MNDHTGRESVCGREMGNNEFLGVALVISDHGRLFIKILRYTNATTSKYSSKTFTLVQCLIITRDVLSWYVLIAFYN